MKVLVTGGGGFLGSHIVAQLLARGDEVTSLTRSDYPALRALGARTRQGDICVPEDMDRALEGQDAVVHTAAMVGAWGAEDAFARVNIEGTRVVVEACRRAGVTRLVFTSSPSVVFDGADLVDAGQDTPYPSSYPTPYARTKAVSEQLALAAHDPGGLRVTALRPQLMWGPGDPHLLPMIVARARRGALRVVGDGQARVDITYIDNAARAHLDALDALARGEGEPNPGGKPYFISNGEPVVLWDWIAQLLELIGEPGPRGAVPRPLALTTGWACELAWRALRLSGEPPVTRYVALKMSTDQWYDLEPARRDLGYEPHVSMQEGLERLAQSWRQGEEQ